MNPIGPYSPIIKAGDLYFISGQIGVEPDSNSLVEGIGAQTQQIMNNLAALLDSVDLTVENLVKTTIYLKDINDFEKVNEIYADGLKDTKPARATVAVADLPKGALIEIEAIATKQQ